MQPSPAARRTVELLSHLAAWPGRAFSVSELARALAQNRATCQAILLSLERAHWVRRDARKSWTLGAGLISIGDAAESNLPGIDALRSGVAALSERLGFEALASIETGGQIVVVAHASGPSQSPPAMRVGQTIPCVPPLGLVFVAWSGDEAFARWLDRATVPLSRRDVGRFRRAAALAREQGYCMTLDPLTRRGLGTVVARHAREPRSAETVSRRDRLVRALAHDEYLVVDRDPLRAPLVSQLVAPVFGPDGEVAAAISLVASPEQISAGNAGRLTDALLACARTARAQMAATRIE
ncbi:MAG: helix-turn-helix domain-containing protein [Myxococcota bacterium]